MRGLRVLTSALLGALLLGACGVSGDGAPTPSDTATVTDESGYEQFMEATKGLFERAWERSQAGEYKLLFPGPEMPFPETEIVRFVTLSEKPEAWRACMVEAGWDVSVSSDGGMTPPRDLPYEQMDAYQMASYICLASYPIDARTQQHSAEQVKIRYDYLVETQKPCLESYGIQVSEPPSWETYRAGWVSDGHGGLSPDGAGNWSPYEFVHVSEDLWNTLNENCPQSPPDELMWPDGVPNGD
ncbi:MAG: hypothetical protein LBC29_04420 [Propionibacteriaceae bacterium]|jgi:hypothetical protein|nr:hypothetical protein [Propionibacteriaceae bacterium]